MGKSVKEMSYEELLAERERLKTSIRNTKSPFLKRDYTKCLNKITCEIKQYEKFRGVSAQ